MKIINYLILSLFLIVLSSCSKDNPAAPGDGGGLGGGNTGGANINFTIEIVQDQQGKTYFGIKPSADVKITSIKITQTQQSIDETINNDSPDTHFPKDEYITIEINQDILVLGQQWTFVFNGSMAQGGQTFSKTVNFSIP